MVQPGLYNEKKLLGAKVRVVSTQKYEVFDNQVTYFIKSIDYRISIDGKLAVTFVLDGLEGHRFLPGDLVVEELPICNNNL